MKMCDEHYEKLKEAVRVKGMWHLVSKSGAEAVRRINSPVFDPLLDCCLRIYTNAVRSAGLYILEFDKEGGEYCPLCELDKYGKEQNSDDWINQATDDVLYYCAKENLLNIEN